MRSFSINEFCKMHGICRAQFYLMQSRGDAPRTFKIGRLVRISEEANNAWLVALEERRVHP